MCESADELVLGVDLGGSKILTAVVKPRGEMLSSDESTTPATEGREIVIQSILDSAHSAMRQAGYTIAEISAIGIGAQYPVKLIRCRIKIHPQIDSKIPGSKIPVSTIR